MRRRHACVLLLKVPRGSYASPPGKVGIRFGRWRFDTCAVAALVRITAVVSRLRRRRDSSSPTVRVAARRRRSPSSRNVLVPAAASPRPASISARASRTCPPCTGRAPGPRPRRNDRPDTSWWPPPGLKPKTGRVRRGLRLRRLLRAQRTMRVVVAASMPPRSQRQPPSISLARAMRGELVHGLA